MSRELSDKKLAVLGAGKLGGILLRAYLKQGLFVAKRVTATVSGRTRAGMIKFRPMKAKGSRPFSAEDGDQQPQKITYVTFITVFAVTMVFALYTRHGHSVLR
jgi:pyrroline-5-carboxylate reductase